LEVEEKETEGEGTDLTHQVEADRGGVVSRYSSYETSGAMGGKALDIG